MIGMWVVTRISDWTSTEYNDLRGVINKLPPEREGEPCPIGVLTAVGNLVFFDAFELIPDLSMFTDPT